MHKEEDIGACRGEEKRDSRGGAEEGDDISRKVRSGKKEGSTGRK